MENDDSETPVTTVPGWAVRADQPRIWAGTRKGAEDFIAAGLADMTRMHLHPAKRYDLDVSSCFAIVEGKRPSGRGMDTDEGGS